MESTARRSGGGLFEGLYKVLMRRNSVYVTFVIVGAFAGERAVDYGVKKLWESNNVGCVSCPREEKSIMPEKKGSISARVHLQSSVVADVYAH